MSLDDNVKTSPHIVWHIPQIPGKPFTVETDNLVVAKLVLNVLADYDLFQFENKIKPDYANMGGIVVWSDDDGGYVDCEDDDG